MSNCNGVKRFICVMQAMISYLHIYKITVLKILSKIENVKSYKKDLLYIKSCIPYKNYGNGKHE